MGDIHPLAGREGEGPPVCPPGWRWRAGQRIRDMYFYPPGETTHIRSQVALNAHLSSHPGSPSPTEFKWIFTAQDFQDGSPLPGKLRTGKRPPERAEQTESVKKSKGKTSAKERGKEKKEGNAGGSKPEKPTNENEPIVVSDDDDPTPKKKQARKSRKRGSDSTKLVEPSSIEPSSEPQNMLIESPESPKPRTLFIDYEADLLLQKEADPSSSHEKLSSLIDVQVIRRLSRHVTEEEEVELEKLVEANDTLSVEKWLQCLFNRLRKVQAPDSFGVSELIAACSNWVCKHERPQCLLEEAQLYKLGGGKVGGGTWAGKRMAVVEEYLKSSESSVCVGCTCTVCKNEVHSQQTWSYLQCENCYHVAHLDCAINSKQAGVVKDYQLDAELLCTSCLKKTDLVPFWKARIKDALVVDRTLLNNHLYAAVRVLEGTERSTYEAVHPRVKALYDAVSSEQDCADIQEILEQVHASLGSLQVFDSGIYEMVDGENDRSVKLDVDEQTVAELKKKAEADYSSWLKSEKRADDRRFLLKQAQADLEKAEKEALNADNEAKSLAAVADFSRKEMERAQSKLRLINMGKNLEKYVGEEGTDLKKAVELLILNLNQELNGLQARQEVVGNLELQDVGEFLTKLNERIEVMKEQEKKMKDVREELELLFRHANATKV